MKSKTNVISMTAKKARKKKMNYQHTARAIEMKLEQIKKENKLPAALNSNTALFGNRI
jgi:di/tripeptidase